MGRDFHANSRFAACMQVHHVALLQHVAGRSLARCARSLADSGTFLVRSHLAPAAASRIVPEFSTVSAWKRAGIPQIPPRPVEILCKSRVTAPLPSHRNPTGCLHNLVGSEVPQPLDFCVTPYALPPGTVCGVPCAGRATTVSSDHVSKAIRQTAINPRRVNTFSGLFDSNFCMLCGCCEEACICDEPDPARGDGDI